VTWLIFDFGLAVGRRDRGVGVRREASPADGYAPLWGRSRGPRRPRRAADAALLLQPGAGEFAHVDATSSFSKISRPRICSITSSMSPPLPSSQTRPRDQQLLVGLEGELQGVAHRCGLGDEADFLHEVAHSLEILVIGLGLSRSRRRTRPTTSSRLFWHTGIRAKGMLGNSRKTSPTVEAFRSVVTTVRGVMISLTRTSSSERALAMMFDSLRESVPSFAPFSASRMISRSEPRSRGAP